jgi:hypothetical protein
VVSGTTLSTFVKALRSPKLAKEHAKGKLDFMFGLTSDQLTLFGGGLAVIVGLVLAIILAKVFRHASSRDCWERTAWSLRLTFQGAGEPGTWRLFGKINGFPIEVTVRQYESKSEPSKKKGKKKRKAKHGLILGTTRIRVTIPAGFQPAATLRRRPRRSIHSAPSNGLRTGDSKFDRTIDARGDSAKLLAHFNEETRAKAVAAIPPLGASVEKNKVQCEIAGIAKNHRVFSHAIKSLVSLAAALKGNGESPEHNLLINCLRDTNKEVRNVSFSTLMNRFIYKTETLRAASAMLGSKDPITEMISGMQAGGAGVDRVRASALDTRLPLHMRVRSIEHLIKEHPGRTAAMVVDLIRPISIQLKEKEATKMIELLSQLEGAVGQYALLPFMEAHSLNVQVGALLALGNVGTDAVVPNVQTVIDEAYTDTKVRVVAKQTIAAIRSRALNLQST